MNCSRISWICALAILKYDRFENGGVDYGLIVHKNMRMYQTDGSSNVYTNQDITDNFKSADTSV